MKCPYCGCADTKVLDSRSLEKKKRRRRECPSCLKRFTTYEVLDVPLLMVKKKDGSFEPFDKNKLIKGIYSAINADRSDSRYHSRVWVEQGGPAV